MDKEKMININASLVEEPVFSLTREGLVATAHDPRDGTIEAYESKGSQPILGIQWHPEFLVKYCTKHRRLFEYVVQSL